MRKVTIGLAAALLLMLTTASAVLAHNVATITGTVDCQGNYSITVHGEVYDGVRLIVKLDGTTIYDQAQNGSSAVQDFGPFTGIGATAGEAIEASTSDGSHTSGTLVANPKTCDSPSPSPSPSPTPKVTPSPSVSTDPSSSPIPTPPTTATTGSSSNDDGSGLWLIEALLFGGAIVAFTLQRRLDMRGNL
jgi:hypothetical protein